MIKEAIQYVNGLVKPNVEEINGFKYSDKSLHRINEPVISEEFKIKTLSGVVDYVNQNPDDLKDIRIVIEDFNKVKVYSGLTNEKSRPLVLRSIAESVDLSRNVNTKMDAELFNAFIQTHFIQDKSTQDIFSITGNLETESGLKTEDDGISQNVVVKTSVISKEKISIKNPIMLRPYRTFPEIEQPQSAYVLRIYQGNNAELKTTENHIWINEAVKSIKVYLKENIKEENVIIIA